MKIGVSTYSLHKAINSGEMTVLEVIDWIAQAGGEHVEIVPIGFKLGEDQALIQSIVKRAADAGLPISNYAIGADFAKDSEEERKLEVQRVMREVEIAAKLGVKLMRHDVAWCKDTSMNNFRARLPRLADACAQVADYAADFGITTSVENHGYFIQASDRVQMLVAEVNRPNFKTTMDIGNFMCADEDSVAAVKCNVGIASMIHIKDFYLRKSAPPPGTGWFPTSSGRALRGAIIGHGDIDIPEVLRVIKASGYDGYLSVEFEGLEACQQGTKLGLDYVRTTWSRIS